MGSQEWFQCINFVSLFFFISAPPTYAECVFGKSNMRDEEDNEHTKGQMEYAPAYPYYNLS